MREGYYPVVIEEELLPPRIIVRDGDVVLLFEVKGESRTVWEVTLGPEEAIAFYNRLGETIGKMTITL
jgi:hypothetical protein